MLRENKEFLNRENLRPESEEKIDQITHNIHH